MTKLPNGWEVKKLEDIFNIERGGSPRPIQDYLTNDENGINWIKISDINNQKYIYETKEKIIEEGLKKSKLVVEGDFLISNSMSFGKPVIVKMSKGAIHDGWLLLREKITLCKDYFYYLFCSGFMYSLLSSKAAGSTVKNLNINMVKELEVPLPPLEEQGKIVKILDEKFASIDESIRLAKDDLLSLDELWQSILNDSFNPLKSKLDNVKYPKTWEVKKLEDIAKIKGGKRLPKGEKLLDNKTDYCYIRVSDFNNYGTIDTNSVKYINFDIYDKLKNYSINHKNLYISIAGTIGKTGIIPKELNGSILTENAVKLEYLQDDISNDFIYYFTLSESFKNQIFNYTKTVAQPKLAITRLKELQIPLPPLEEQERIAKELESKAKTIKELKELYTKRLKDYEELKESLLDLAFKGGL